MTRSHPVIDSVRHLCAATSFTCDPCGTARKHLAVAPLPSTVSGKPGTGATDDIDGRIDAIGVDVGAAALADVPRAMDRAAGLEPRHLDADRRSAMDARR